MAFVVVLFVDTGPGQKRDPGVVWRSLISPKSAADNGYFVAFFEGKPAQKCGVFHPSSR
jgi:hypothetical protein